MNGRDKIDTWRIGGFIDKHEYRNLREDWKDIQRAAEALLVRPSPTGNAICQAGTPFDALWIAQRLNVAARSEQLGLPDRGKFEKWAKDKGHGRGMFEFRRSGHCYHDGQLEDLWRAWQYAVENN